MAFRPVNLGAIDIKDKEGIPFTGYYMGNKQIATKLGPQVIWEFVDEEEKPFGIYGFTNLNNAMKNIKGGQLVRITYTGTKFLKTRFHPEGQDVHQALVEVDEPEPAPTKTNGKKTAASHAPALFEDGSPVPQE